MQDRASLDLKENLLAEYKSQATLKEQSSFILDDASPEKTRRIQELQKRENKERYIDIVNVHAAAVNASVASERPFRSLDDATGNGDVSGVVDQDD